MRDLRETQLPRYCVDLLDRAEALSERPIIYRAGSDAASPRFRMAYADEPAHVLSVLPQWREHVTHYAVTSAYEVIRFWSAPETDRYWAWVPRRTRLPPDMEVHLREEAERGDEHELRRLSRELRHGLAVQVTRRPTALRIEYEVAGDLPEHHSLQAAFLRDQAKADEFYFGVGAAEGLPEAWYAASAAMDAASTLVAHSLADAPIPRTLRGHALRLGKQLVERLRAAPAGHMGDREAVNAWSRELELSDWYQWRSCAQG